MKQQLIKCKCKTQTLYKFEKKTIKYNFFNCSFKPEEESSLRAGSGVSAVLGFRPDPEKRDFVFGINLHNFRGPSLEFFPGPLELVVPVPESKKTGLFDKPAYCITSFKGKLKKMEKIFTKKCYLKNL